MNNQNSPTYYPYGMGALEEYRPQDGYLSGSEEYRKDNRRLTKEEQLQRLNPFGGRGHLNQQQYKDKYNPDGSHRYNMMDNLNPAAPNAAPNASPPALTQGGAEPTTHTMPDGTVMEGATHEAYLQANQPALDLQDEYGNLGAEFGDDPLVPGQEGYVAPVEDRSVPSGVLSQRLQTLGQMDAVNQPDNTSRKRDKGMSGENLWQP